MAAPEVHSAKENAPDVKVRVLGLLGRWERRYIWYELQEEVTSYRKRNMAIEAKLAEMEQNTHQYVATREEVIKREDNVAQAMRADYVAAHFRFEIERDRLTAALTSVYACVTGVLAEQQQRITELTKSIAEVKDSYLRKEATLEKIAAVDGRWRASAESQLKVLCSFHSKSIQRVVRCEHAAVNCEQKSSAKFQEKVELGVGNRLRVFQGDHEQMTKEVQCQAHRIGQLLDANSRLQRRKRALDSSIRQERQHHGHIVQSIMFWRLTGHQHRNLSLHNYLPKTNKGHWR
mmetsp:Transcript_16973/g.55211  ORF Transcript_16973/g.55211 Transcript_16973/m.55211 type:complete len:290 (-) Transcript_16973:133-1002(-)